ncbi:endoplasmic reticulum-based factor for assembly of V-ATPase-domain-containing protein [Xylariaceae sp. FL1272]|nr:endoplasmic reticulum-based factor for assembly of V-ATPase-domain-containing protein [Xylariaceae sp. FL1272]
MVLLTMTASIVEALKSSESLDLEVELQADADSAVGPDLQDPSLENPAVGNPINHGQIIDIWKSLRGKGHADYSLEQLLRGSTIYVPPPPPKAEQTNEYKALMARLRREKEERSYERMIQKAPARETFAQRFPMAPMAHSFAEVNKPSKESDWGVDDIEYGDVQKQVTLLVNFLVSVVGCGAALWRVAQWWPVTARLFLSLGGAIVVAIVEVAVYSAYTWRMSEGDNKANRKKEVKEILQTWVVGEKEKDPNTSEPMVIPSAEQSMRESKPEPSLRKRLKGPV